MASYTRLPAHAATSPGGPRAASYADPRMPDLTCPACGAVGAPAAQIRTVAICGACGASLVVADDGTATRATATDTTALDLAELQQLRRARGAIRRPR